MLSRMPVQYEVKGVCHGSWEVGNSVFIAKASLSLDSGVTLEDYDVEIVGRGRNANGCKQKWR
jgi:hypothetical protein